MLFTYISLFSRSDKARRLSVLMWLDRGTGEQWLTEIEELGSDSWFRIVCIGFWESEE